MDENMSTEAQSENVRDSGSHIDRQVVNRKLTFKSTYVELPTMMDEYTKEREVE